MRTDRPALWNKDGLVFGHDGKPILGPDPLEEEERARAEMQHYQQAYLQYQQQQAYQQQQQQAYQQQQQEAEARARAAAEERERAYGVERSRREAAEKRSRRVAEAAARDTRARAEAAARDTRAREQQKARGEKKKDEPRRARTQEAAPEPASAAGNLYTILNVTPTATPREILKAYHKQSVRHHPDKNTANPNYDKEVHWFPIARAYNVLSDPELRAIYDRDGEEGLRPFATGGRSKRPLRKTKSIRKRRPLRKTKSIRKKRSLRKTKSFRKKRSLRKTKSFRKK